MTKKIFVQIASYRDKELLPTLRDAVLKSSGENELSFGIMWQKDDSESIEEFTNDSKCRIISCDWQDSKGLGWARSLTQSLYKDEDYTLQLDSHHRFIKDWDKILIDMYNGLLDDSEKPLLTSYAAGYDPDKNTILSNIPCRILFHDFKSSGTIWLNPTPIPNYENLEKPIRARFVSGHYFFTTGQHCIEYKYDPDLYFAGDEITLSARSYTLGYDLYHPHINVVWHHYGRNDRAKHWTDHTATNKNNNIIDKTWNERDSYSKQRIRQLLGQENNNIDLGTYGLGTKRSLNDYERYAGFDFKNRRIQSSAIKGIEPPVTFNSESEWVAGFKKETPVTLIEWYRKELLQNIDNISFVKIELMSLQRKIIYSSMLNTNFIKNNSILKLNVIDDNIPMKFILTVFNKDNEKVNQVYKDLRNHIHWS